MPSRKISQAGISLIKLFEGCRLTSYRDIKGLPTIGVGHMDPNMEIGIHISQDQADELLRRDLEAVENCINSSVKVPINQNQFDALCCLVFNIGQGNFKKSTLLRDLNAGFYDAASDQFLAWDHAGGIEVEALNTRRRAERALFLKQDA